MKQKISIVFIVFCLGSLFYFFTAAFNSVANEYDETSKKYYIDRTADEVGSHNIVTGIYLDYRLFDSIFEAGILFVSVTGIVFMVKKDEDLL